MSQDEFFSAKFHLPDPTRKDAGARCSVRPGWSHYTWAASLVTRDNSQPAPDTATLKVLRNFATEIRNAARATCRTFSEGGEDWYPGGNCYSAVEYDDALQEASVLVLGYAGLVKTSAHYHHGNLAKIEGYAHDVKAVVYVQLVRDLEELFGKRMRKESPSDDMARYDWSADQQPDDHWIDRIEFNRYVKVHYPYLFLHYLKELLVTTMVNQTGIARRTLYEHMEREKNGARIDPFFLDRLSSYQRRASRL